MRPGGLYVEYDALQDTRLGTLAKHYPAVFERCVNSDAYYLREEDDFTAFGGPDKETFRALYDKRDIETAQMSIMTAVPFVVKNLIGILEKERESSPYIGEIKMDVNIYPYVMDAEEIVELQKIMMVYGGINTIPNIISIKPDELTPEYIKGRYVGVIMYDFRNWLLKYTGKIKPADIYYVTFIAPQLLYGEKPTPEVLKEMGFNEDIHPYQFVEVALREFLYLESLPPCFFSSYRPDIIEREFPYVDKTTKA